MVVAMKILVVGRTGQLGRELERLAWPASAHVLQVDRNTCDLTDANCVRQTVLEAAADVVVNAAAYTAVDRAEKEPEAAMRTNAEGAAALARSCAEAGAVLIHLSTDYVFDGTKTKPYLEDDAVNPVSVYGLTKLAGERAVQEFLPRHVILRTSWVFSSHGTNFVRTMLRLGSQRDEIGVVADQCGAPTSARDIAQAVAAIVRVIEAGEGVWGTFHYAGAEPTTWYGFAQAIFGASRNHAHVKVRPITSAEFGAAARRPANSVLDCSRIGKAYGIDQPCWRTALSRTLAELDMQITSP
jgi:dTDP-4-dehydrorhamnose reductase